MRKSSGKKISALSLIAVLTGLFSATFFVLPVAPAHAVPSLPFLPCDVVAGIGDGQFNVWRPDVCPGVPSSLTLVTTLLTGNGASETFTTGAAFDVPACDANGVGVPNPGVPCLYGTGFSSHTMWVWDNVGTLLGTCGAAGGFAANLESSAVVAGSTGIAPGIVAGQAGASTIATVPDPCTPTSTITQHGPATTQNRGTDWQDPLDTCNTEYTSEGTSVFSFNLCTNTQNADVAAGTLTGTVAYAVRNVPGTGVLVADSGHVSVVNAGVESSTCDSSSPGAGGLFSMDVLFDKATFAVGSFSNNGIDYMTTAHCVAGQAAPDATFPSVAIGQATAGLFGLAIFGEFTQTSHGVPEFSAPSVLVAAMGLLVIVLFRKFSFPKIGKL